MLHGTFAMYQPQLAFTWISRQSNTGWLVQSVEALHLPSRHLNNSKVNQLQLKQNQRRTSAISFTDVQFTAIETLQKQHLDKIRNCRHQNAQECLLVLKKFWLQWQCHNSPQDIIQSNHTVHQKIWKWGFSKRSSVVEVPTPNELEIIIVLMRDEITIT